MNKLSFKIFLSLLFFVLFFSCERDDICLADVTESPDLIVLMLDKENTNNRKTPNGFSIRALGTQDILPGIVSDSMALPLKINDNSVQFEFILNFGSDNENIDTLQISRNLIYFLKIKNITQIHIRAPRGPEIYWWALGPFST